MPSTYWTYALATTVYLINRPPTLILTHKSPFQALFGHVSDYHKLCMFGCQCYLLLVPYRTHKLQPKSNSCVFLRYSLSQNAFKCLDHQVSQLYLSRHVTFDKKHFRFKSLVFSASLAHSLPHPVIVQPVDPAPVPLVHVATMDDCCFTLPSPTPVAISSLSTKSGVSLSHVSITAKPSSSLVSSPHLESSPNRPPVPLVHTHPMVTHAQNNIFCLK